jgi:hypothetical protein
LDVVVIVVFVVLVVGALLKLLNLKRVISFVLRWLVEVDARNGVDSAKAVVSFGTTIRSYGSARSQVDQVGGRVESVTVEAVAIGRGLLVRWLVWLGPPV